MSLLNNKTQMGLFIGTKVVKYSFAIYSWCVSRKCGLNKHPELNVKERKRYDTHTLTHTETYTHLPLCH